MSNKPIFVATHPRACSTAFERIFMTRRKTLQTIHEPFGDAFYYGPERMSSRFERDETTRIESGFADSTYKTILDRIDREAAEGKRVFIKDITYYLLPPNQQKAKIAPSLQTVKRGVGTQSESEGSEGRSSGATTPDSAVGLNTPPFPFKTHTESGNPTIVPREILERFHFTFLIRHPNRSIPSYYRCCIPPLVEKTGFNPFMPCEAGYDELRRFFDYCKDTGLVGPGVCGQAGKEDTNGGIQICMIDADDLLDDPEGIMKQYCQSVGIPFEKEMLIWDSEEHHAFAKEQFEKWDGFHEDAIDSKDLKPREHKHKVKTNEEVHPEWVEKYGKEAADMMIECVNKNIADYEYLKQFAIKI